MLSPILSYHGSQDHSTLFSGSGSQSGGNGSARSSDRSSLNQEPVRCDYCGKEQHTKEFCWRLHDRLAAGSSRGCARGCGSSTHQFETSESSLIGATPPVSVLLCSRTNLPCYNAS
ncbi:hypothetical protein NE237_012744 [Protea cynaroides]|uniref:Uncharacterized protein n=1 Tax=Protea cynaroides TaxID=273540 RepID=A0A9Q0GZP7_9MAGN|nr:hypothetical protein NE237_012744 [Protea cynaroides]